MSGESPFEVNFAALARAIDDLLVAHHALHAQLRPGYPPLDTSTLVDAMRRYGPESPLVPLWNVSKCVNGLSKAWTGRGIANAPQSVPVVPVPPTVSAAPGDASGDTPPVTNGNGAGHD